MTATIYLHGSKEENLEIGTELGLTGEALDMFKYAAYEVKLTLDVNVKTGEATITHVDDRAVAP
jgi:hypothetical protein